MTKIFVSHTSSDKPLVDALGTLLRGAFVENVEVRSSSASVAGGGIVAGQRWLDWINTQIQESTMTIVILTPFSKTRPWLMWEAGAVSGISLVRGASVPLVPLLFGLSGEDVPSPLRERQTKSGTNLQDIKDLLDSLQQVDHLAYKSEVDVEASIHTYLQSVIALRTPGMHDLFISCPMTSVDQAEYDQLLRAVTRIVEAATASGYRAYSAPINAIQSGIDPEAIAAEEDFPALRSSRNFLMIYPSRLMSSCLMEAGYALINGIPSTYFVKSDEDLPYMLRGAVESFPNARRFRFRDLDEIPALFVKFQRQIIV